MRIEYPGAFYHIVSHGNGRLWLFKKDDDYIAFLRILGECVKRFKGKIHAFVLLRNHIHILIETPLGNISSFMRFALSGYGRYYNREYKRRGSVFKSRYGSFLVQKDRYYHTLIRYIYYNPVKAGIVEKLKEYRWSSLFYLLNEDNLSEIPWFSLSDAYSIISGDKELLEILNEGEVEIEVVYRVFIGDKGWADKILKRNEKKLTDKNINGRQEIKRDYVGKRGIDKIFNLLDTKREKIVKKKRDPLYRAAVYIMRKMLPLTNRELAETMESTEYAISKLYSRLKKSPQKYQKTFEIINEFNEMSRVKT